MSSIAGTSFGNPDDSGGVNVAGLLGDFGSGAAAGASIGTIFGPPGTLIGGGIGGVLGAGAGLIGDLTGPNASDIYNQLMSEFYNSPEYKNEQQALTQLQGQTVQGPTATEKANLVEALNTANQQFGSSYGAIQQGMAARGGVGGSNQAALMAAQGQGQASQMSTSAIQAAAAEEQRREQATQAYQQATAQAMNMQDQYRQWASGQAQQRQDVGQATTAAQIAQFSQGVGSIAGAYNYANKPTTNNPNLSAPGSGFAGGGSPSLANPGAVPPTWGTLNGAYGGGSTGSGNLVAAPPPSASQQPGVASNGGGYQPSAAPPLPSQGTSTYVPFSGYQPNQGGFRPQPAPQW